MSCVVAILRNPEKAPLFSVDERIAMLAALTGLTTMCVWTPSTG